MTLPESIRAQVDWLAANPDHPQAPVAAAALADEYAAWASDPGRFVPRAVLAGLLDDVVRKSRGGVPWDEWETVRRRAEAALDGQCPAWFVLADWERMTEGERKQATDWVSRTYWHVLDMRERIAWATGPVANTPPSGSVASVTGVAADPTGYIWAMNTYQAFGDDLQAFVARELAVGGHLPDGWRLEWWDRLMEGDTLIRSQGQCGPDRFEHEVNFAPLTFTREHRPEHVSDDDGPRTDTVTTHVGRCERCRTVYATRPAVAGGTPVPGVPEPHTPAACDCPQPTGGCWALLRKRPPIRNLEG